jgi:steroid 5-alpha reductase family enzyme
MWFVSLPVQGAMSERGAANLVTVPGMLLWLVGFTFDTLGDLQLSRFRDGPASRGRLLSRRC